jgi:3-oxoacyl-[acyl-carrier-protein] synthase-3
LSRTSIDGIRIAGVSTCVPRRQVDNLSADLGFAAEEVRKVVSMAGVQQRRVVEPGQTATDLSVDAAERLIERLGWPRESIDALILVTQSPDHFLPSSACIAHRELKLGTDCAAFDVGLGCSGYPYGLYLASAMLKGGGHRRVMMLHGETPSRFVDPTDHATVLLFGDAGSATALELEGGASRRGSHFVMHTDGQGHDGLIIRGGAFRDRHPANPRHLALEMDGGAIFNFTVKRVPPLVRDALEQSGRRVEQIDAFVFHQSNRFIMKHLAKKCGIAEERVPMTLADTANCGGPSVAVTMTRGVSVPAGCERTLMLLGYGVGLSWAAAVVTLDAGAVLLHGEAGPRQRPTGH